MAGGKSQSPGPAGARLEGALDRIRGARGPLLPRPHLPGGDTALTSPSVCLPTAPQRPRCLQTPAAGRGMAVLSHRELGTGHLKRSECQKGG